MTVKSEAANEDFHTVIWFYVMLQSYIQTGYWQLQSDLGGIFLNFKLFAS